MGIGTPVSLGLASVANSGTSTTLTTTANAPAGCMIVVAIALPNTGSDTVTSLGDSAGNKYVLVNRAAIAGNLDLEIWFCQNAIALPSGDSITANYTTAAGNGIAIVTAAAVTGVNNGDQALTVPYSSGSTTPSAGPTGTLAQPHEVAFGFVYGYNLSSQATITESSGFTTLETYQENSGAFSTCDFAYEIVSSNEPVTYAPTASVSITCVSTVVTLLNQFDMSSCGMMALP